LRGEIQQELRARAAPFLQPHGGFGQGGGPGGPGGRQPGESGNPAFRPPPGPAFGGAPGYFQVVEPDGHAVAVGGGQPQLPVDSRVVQVARTEKGSFFSTTRGGGVHLEGLTVADRG